MLLKRRLPPTAHGLQDKTPSGEGGSHLVLGTLSAVVGHPINGYLPIPDWCSVQPDSSVREPTKEEPQASATPPRGGGGKNRKGESDSDFYSGSESESGSESGSESESGSSPEYSSEDGSESSSYYSASSSSGENEESGSERSDSEDSGSDSEGTSDDDDDESDSSVGSQSSESSSDSSSGDSSDSSATKGEEGLGLLVLGPGSSSTTAATTTYGASAPAPHTEDLTGLVERMNVAAREDSASPQLGMSASAAVGGGLASLSTAGLRKPGGPIAGLGRTSSTSSVLSADPEGDTSASFPSTLLGHQASGGLEVDYRYSRGRASALSRPSTTLSLRLTFANHGETPVRRIRAVAPRDGTPMEVFPEIQMLPAGATNTATLGIDFGGKAKEVSGKPLSRAHAFLYENVGTLLQNALKSASLLTNENLAVTYSRT